MTEQMTREELEELETLTLQGLAAYAKSRGMGEPDLSDMKQVFYLARRGLDAAPQPIDQAPRDGTIILGCESYRWHPYKPGAPKHLLAKKGRWQKATDYGWDSCTPPDFWIPADQIQPKGD